MIDFKQECTKVHGGRYSYSAVDWSKTDVYIICPAHGLFRQNKYSHKNGAGCAKCAGNARKTLELYSEEQSKIHNNKYQYISYQGARAPLVYICPDHGTIRGQLQNNHLNGSGCPVCQSGNQFLYIMEHPNGSYKIGVSSNPTLRATQVGKGCTVIESWDLGTNQFSAEKHLHNIFKDFRFTNLDANSGNTEFFRLSKDLLQSIPSHLAKFSV